MDHCIAKICAIVAAGVPEPRAILQLGYNLGRLSELTGLGREPFWDAWKDAVATWDRDRLRELAQELPMSCGRPPITSCSRGDAAGSLPPASEPTSAQNISEIRDAEDGGTPLFVID